MARRAANGEGSVWRRPDGRYEGRAYFLAASGKHKPRSFYGKTHKEAHDKLTAALAQAQRGIPIPDKTWKLGDFLDNWLSHEVLTNKRPSTYDQCESITRIYLKPGLGRYSLSQLTVPIVQRFINDQISSGRSLTNAATIRKVLSSALTSAMRQELVTRNVARLVVVPTHTTRQVIPWSFEEATQFLQAIDEEPMRAAYVLLVRYGLRRGEVLGLRWCDVDFSKNSLHIEQQLQWSKRLGFYTGPLKTSSARRTLPLIDEARMALLAHRSKQSLYDTQASPSGPAKDLVFTTSSGLPVDPKNFTRAFRRICRQNEIREITVHHVRHTTNTLLKMLGVQPRDRQLILGHSQLDMTLGVYEHDNQALRRESLTKLGDALTTETEEDQAPGAGLLSSLFAVDGSGCRQLLPSGSTFSTTLRHLTDYFMEPQPGFEPGTSSLPYRPEHSLFTGLTEVSLFLTVRRRRWKVGKVAVNLAVKDV
ncbi:site-specific integrase [Lentzea sp. NPDC051838]|uniref:tyrosine-type recombinase/integrase n=1 Tax=Lentzea sp. NPDC051838 TaxID=3154849 RepID=UPI003442CF5F